MTQRIVEESRICVTVDDKEIIWEILKTAALEDKTIFDKHPGFLAMAILTIDKNEPLVQEAYMRMKDRVKGTFVNNAINYMNRVGLGLEKAGKAFGILFNAAYAECHPDMLTENQKHIFKNTIDLEGITTFINAANQTNFKLDKEGKNTQSASRLLEKKFSNIGTPETNAFATLLRTSINNVIGYNTVKMVLTTMLQQDHETSLDNVLRTIPRRSSVHPG